MKVKPFIQVFFLENFDLFYLGAETIETLTFITSLLLKNIIFNFINK